MSQQRDLADRIFAKLTEDMPDPVVPKTYAEVCREAAGLFHDFADGGDPENAFTRYEQAMAAHLRRLADLLQGVNGGDPAGDGKFVNLTIVKALSAPLSDP